MPIRPLRRRTLARGPSSVRTGSGFHRLASPERRSSRGFGDLLRHSLPDNLPLDLAPSDERIEFGVEYVPW